MGQDIAFLLGAHGEKRWYVNEIEVQPSFYFHIPICARSSSSEAVAENEEQLGHGTEAFQRDVADAYAEAVDEWLAEAAVNR